MELVILNEKEYHQYAKDHPNANFLNSIYSGRKFVKRGWDCEYLGLKNEGELVGATLLVSTPLHGSKYFYAPRGFLIDFHNRDYVMTFTSLIKQHIKKQGALYLKIDPYVSYQERDINGKVVKDGYKNDDVIQNLSDCGFIHQGFNKGYDDTVQCRWMSVLNLKDKTKDQILKEMNSQTRQNIKNVIKNGIKVRRLAFEELYILNDIVDATSERRGFMSLSLEYYQHEYELFEHHANAYYSYLDLNDYEQRLEEERQKELDTVASAEANLQENPHSKNSKTRLQSAKQHLDALAKRLDEAKVLREECGDEVPLAAALFIEYGKEVIYLTSGSYDQYKRFKGPYAMQWHMINLAIDKGCDAYNFYGISGLFEKGDDGYGVFDFKRGFNADVIELVGDFILPINKSKYKLYQLAQGLKNKIK